MIPGGVAAPFCFRFALRATLQQNGTLPSQTTTFQGWAKPSCQTQERVLVIGVATGKTKATNNAFKDEWVFDITVRDGKLTRIQEYIDTQALVRASDMAASPKN